MLCGHSDPSGRSCSLALSSEVAKRALHQPAKTLSGTE
ncbi:hypothetical protein RIEGSTA812A_PEG_1124 [invertebrate metagenome]|uniref:Uncharacterized protein n=1 Tax=invertebrate metagenome TaxID=1711999 RepID=A0A484H7W7_9ZZZZ